MLRRRSSPSPPSHLICTTTVSQQQRRRGAPRRPVAATTFGGGLPQLRRRPWLGFLQAAPRAQAPPRHLCRLLPDPFKSVWTNQPIVSHAFYFVASSPLHGCPPCRPQRCADARQRTFALFRCTTTTALPSLPFFASAANPSLSHQSRDTQTHPAAARDLCKSPARTSRPHRLQQRSRALHGACTCTTMPQEWVERCFRRQSPPFTPEWPG